MASTVLLTLTVWIVTSVVMGSLLGRRLHLLSAGVRPLPDEPPS